MRRSVWTAALLGIAALSPLSASSAIDRIDRTMPIAAGSALRIDATEADVSVIGSKRADVRVEIVRSAPAAEDLSKFPARIETTPDGVRVSVVQADGGRDAHLKATIAVEIPDRTTVPAIRVFEGRVRLAALTATCDVDLRRGPIEATGLRGRIRLESGIGSIDVLNAGLTPGGMMRLRVFNGPVRVRFAQAPANARILALTFNGGIASDIPLTKKDRFGPRFGETTLGSGDPVLSVDVVKGDISLTVGR